MALVIYEKTAVSKSTKAVSMIELVEIIVRYLLQGQMRKNEGRYLPNADTPLISFNR